VHTRTTCVPEPLHRLLGRALPLGGWRHFAEDYTGLVGGEGQALVINQIRVARTRETVDAMVSLCGFEDMVVWQRRIQPYIARSKGIGSDWDWPAYFLGCSLVEELMGRTAFAFQVLVERPDGGTVPVRQAICSLNYFFPKDKGKRCVFAWFLAATPQDALLGPRNRKALRRDGATARYRGADEHREWPAGPRWFARFAG
jgi:hypothetical protein